MDATSRTVILVDDGAATGASMLAAVRAVRKLGASRIVVALPVASHEARSKLRDEADEVVCISTPISFYAVGQWYTEFTQTTDDEVTDLLERAAQPLPGAEARHDASPGSTIVSPDPMPSLPGTDAPWPGNRA